MYDRYLHIRANNTIAQSLTRVHFIYHPVGSRGQINQLAKKLISLLAVFSGQTCEHKKLSTDLASYPGVREEGRRKRTPGTHCLRMHLISEASRKIGYFRIPPHNVDANF